MKNQYSVQIKQWCLVALWVMGFVLPARSQTVQPPVIQWQQVIENSYTGGTVRTVKAINGGYAVLIADSRTVLRLSANGNILWEKPIPTYVVTPDGSPNGIYGVVESTGLAATSDGGFGILERDNYGWNLARINANGDRDWVKRLDNEVRFYTNYPLLRNSLISTSDGGFLEVGQQNVFRSTSAFTAIKYDKDGNVVWSQGGRYSEDGQPTILYATGANRAIATNDGGFIIIGSTTITGKGSVGWVAKLDIQGKIISQKVYDYVSTLTDITPSPYVPEGYIVVGRNANNAGTSTLFINPSGNGDNTSGTFKGALASGLPGIVSTGNTSHEVFDVADENNGDFRLVSYNSANDTRWIKTLGGSGLDDARSIIATDDGGYLVAGVTTSTDGDVKGKSQNNLATWIVKLSSAAPVNALTLTQPTYNCQTGAISFNTSGGDGSPITYTAPGISRANATDNFGTVEQGLRNDPKPITITATQSGYTTSYTFDFGTNCSYYPAPALISAIPDEIRTAGKQITNDIIIISSHFRAQGASKSFRPIAGFQALGLPDGLWLDDASSEAGASAYIFGTPTTTGVYTVTINATTANAQSQTTTTTFKITIVDPSSPSPPTGTLILTQPTYNCQTGAITFNTSGGDGSPITYTAPGISRANATDNFGTVEQGLRNDPKPITITASQGRQTASYTFDFGAYCNNPQPPQPPVTPPTGNALTLLTPTYDCGSGSFTFRSSGGDGSPIEYMAIGITGWTINPSEFVDKDSRTANDVQPFTLMARQSGQTVTLTWDLKAACGRANSRIQADPTDNPFRLTVLGNPVHEQLRVLIQGADSQPVTLRLTDLTGRLVESRTVLLTDADREQVFELHRQGAGLLLLRASSGSQQRTVKVLKQ